jgi:hypothetical protein
MLANQCILEIGTVLLLVAAIVVRTLMIVLAQKAEVKQERGQKADASSDRIAAANQDYGNLQMKAKVAKQSCFSCRREVNNIKWKARDVERKMKYVAEKTSSNMGNGL